MKRKMTKKGKVTIGAVIIAGGVLLTNMLTTFITIAVDALDSAYALEEAHVEYVVEEVPVQMYYNGRLATLIEEDTTEKEEENK